MRKAIVRIPLLFAVIIVLGFIFYQYTVNFTGDGKKTPEAALPTDHDYEWIEGPKQDKEVRYFFLADDHYFGTGIVRKNVKGWTKGHGAYSKLPDLEENKIRSAYSDDQIIFGIIKKTKDLKVKVNNVEAKLQSLDSLPKEVIEQYEVKDCFIWYVNLDDLKDKKSFTIHVLDENDNIISELII